MRTGPVFGSFNASTWWPGVWPGPDFDDYGAITEQIVVSVCQDHGFTGLKAVVSGLLLRLYGEHRVTFGLVNKPGGAGERVRIGHMIKMIVGECEVGDGCGRITQGG
jgi:hypothetical protein